MSRQFWAASSILVILIVLSSCQTMTYQKSELSNDYYNIGNAYSDLGKYEQAAEYYKRSLELNPDLNQAAFNLARTNLEIGENRAALKLLNGLEELDGQNLMVLEMLGFAWYKMEDSVKSAGYYRKCLGIDPAHVRSLYNLAILEMEKENWKESGEYLTRLLDIEDKQEYRLLRAELAVARGETETAISYYVDLVLEYGGSSESYTALKELYMETEEFSKALDMLDSLIAEETEDSVKSELYFEKCQIEILTLDDVILGQADLISALETGFNDSEKLDELITGADSMFRADLEKIIKDKITKPEPSDISTEGELKDKAEDEKTSDEKIKAILNY